MTFNGSRRFVGLGFGAIQAGLFVYEASRTGDYAPPLVVDVRADLYSMGADGSTAAPFTAARARDDIVRANEGGFVGLAGDY